MNDKDEIAAYPADQKAIDGLIEKGLIRLVGRDPLGRGVYENTELGDLVADELDKEDDEFELHLPYEDDPYDDLDDDFVPDYFEWDEI